MNSSTWKFVKTSGELSGGILEFGQNPIWLDVRLCAVGGLVCVSGFSVYLHFEIVTMCDKVFWSLVSVSAVKCIQATFICGLWDPPSDKPDWQQTNGGIWYCTMCWPYLLAVCWQSQSPSFAAVVLSPLLRRHEQNTKVVALVPGQSVSVWALSHWQHTM